MTKTNSDSQINFTAIKNLKNEVFVGPGKDGYRSSQSVLTAGTYKKKKKRGVIYTTHIIDAYTAKQVIHQSLNICNPYLV